MSCYFSRLVDDDILSLDEVWQVTCFDLWPEALSPAHPESARICTVTCHLNLLDQVRDGCKPPQWGVWLHSSELTGTRDLASLGDGFGDLQEGLWLGWPAPLGLEPGWGARESHGHTAAILKADKCPMFPQTGRGDGAARPEQLGGGWWQETV